MSGAALDSSYVLLPYSVISLALHITIILILRSFKHINIHICVISEDILRPGREMVCAGYCAYGSATELVITYNKGVQRFTLDPSLGEFILTADNMTLPEVQKTIYSVNEGNYLTWDDNMKVSKN